jgi:hypothetical protein
VLLARTLDQFESLNDAPGTLLALHALGDLEKRAGRAEEALRLYEQALPHAPAGTARAVFTLLRVADACFRLRRLDAARGLYERCLAEVGPLDDPRLTERAHAGLAETLLADDEPLQALEHALTAARQHGLLTQGLDEETVIGGEDQRNEVIEFGLRAALAKDRSDAAVELVEQGRSAALLAMLGAREAMRAVDVPEELRLELQEWDARHTAARLQLEAATREGRRTEVREAHANHQEARVSYRAAARSVERALADGSRVRHSVTAAPEEIRQTLWPKESLVLYACLGEELAAVVVTREGSRLARLGPLAGIEDLCLRLRETPESTDEAENAQGRALALAALDELARRLLDPLNLPKDLRALLVSPHGPLARVPFPAIAMRWRAEPPRVALVPSGSVYRLLASARAVRGESLLAFGDPTYGQVPEEAAHALRLRGPTLLPLPGSRDEIAAIRREGDVVRFGADATEPRLAADLATKARWRAVHFACHGLIDIDAPAFSCLAISGAPPAGDGFLTTMEILRSRIETDLVVLSACETGVGPVRHGEGILGFTRAFMIAGAPRVLVSLWKVDDAATGALMARFYEAWRPRDGGPGVPVADALREGQDAVRREPKWSHPAYWAAWILWGLPE